MPYSEIVADEESSFFPVVRAYDENGNNVVPETLEWILSDGAGTEIASGTVDTPALDNPIALTGAHLALPEGQRSLRELALLGTYTSPTTGTVLSVKGALYFHIAPISAVPVAE